MSTIGPTGRRAPAPLRLVVWILAAVYLGRIYYNNSLYDLRQLTAFDVLVRSGAIAVVLGFAYWNLALADPDIIGMIWGVVAFFIAKVLLVAGVIRVAGTLVDYRELEEQRRFKAAGPGGHDGYDD